MNPLPLDQEALSLPNISDGVVQCFNCSRTLRQLQQDNQLGTATFFDGRFSNTKGGPGGLAPLVRPLRT